MKMGEFFIYRYMAGEFVVMGGIISIIIGFMKIIKVKKPVGCGSS
jgi:hypothetical protein